jgi:hypothetical protein
MDKNENLKKKLKAYKERLGIGAPENEFIDCYESGKKIIPECIEQNEGEIPVRQYDVAILRTPIKFMRAEGRIQVTNKRLIFRATGRSLMGRTTLQHEFNLAEIGGIEIRKDWRFGIWRFLGAAICSLIVASIFGLLTGAIYEANEIGGIICAFIFGLAGLLPFFIVHKRFLIKALLCGASIGAFQGVAKAGASIEEIAFAAAFGESVPNENGYMTVFAVIAAIICLVALFLQI